MRSVLVKLMHTDSWLADRHRHVEHLKMIRMIGNKLIIEVDLLVSALCPVLQILLQKGNLRTSRRTQTRLQVWKERPRMEGVGEVINVFYLMSYVKMWRFIMVWIDFLTTICLKCLHVLVNCMFAFFYYIILSMNPFVVAMHWDVVYCALLEKKNFAYDTC